MSDDKQGVAPITPSAFPSRGQESTVGRDGVSRRDSVAHAPARTHDIEARTQFAPDSQRLVTDILDSATREVLYRIPPQSVTDAVVQVSEALSRYERLMAGAASPPRSKATS